MKRIAAMRQIYAAENVLLLKNRYDILGIEKEERRLKSMIVKNQLSVNLIPVKVRLFIRRTF